MAIRQYIGARYTTKVYENTVTPGSAEWQASVTYEPLTLVTYNNSSYLSKKTVPASVGNPADNPSYWVVTGDYNGQIATLQNEIDEINDTTIPGLQSTLQSEIDNINNVAQKNIIALADSTNNKYPDTSGNTVWEWIMAMNSWDSTKFRGYAYPGSGFIRHEGNHGTFLENLTSIASSMTTDDKASIGTILVLCGANDWPYTRGQNLQAIYDFSDFCKSTFPNAKILIAYVENYHQDHTDTYGTRAQHWDVFRTFSDCNAHGAAFLADVNVALKDATFMSSDWLHPSANGRKYIAEKLNEALITGRPTINRDVIDVPITFDSIVAGAYDSVAKIREKIVDNQLILSGGSGKRSGALYFNYGDLEYTGGIKDIKIGELPHTSGYMNYPYFDIPLAVCDAVVQQYSDSVTTDTDHPISGMSCMLYVNPDGEVHLSIYGPGITLTTGYIARIQYTSARDITVPATMI